jgi:cell division protein FtsI/penicillin-binding protein 2
MVAASDDPHALIGTWQYTASLVAHQQPDSQVWTIAWAPDVLAPGLTDSTYPAVVAVAAETTGAVDASGTDLRAYSDAGLNTIASDLQDQAQANPRQGTPGLAVRLQNETSQAVPGSETVLVAPRAGPGLATTIDPRAEAAARSAIRAYANSSMVAIQPSTGKILAVANAGDQDNALTARVAPGSTMKVITSAALFNAGVLSESSDVACPAAYTVQGVTYHNDNGEELPGGTSFITDFAQSCNNAFSMQWTHLSGLLASTARTYFGLNQVWNIGIAGQSAPYFSAPADASGSELAEEAFGQGALTASPLAMASVAATVDSGTFRQPYLLAGTQQQVTATALPYSTDRQLWDMMHAVVTSGTAASVGFGPGVYAKTGTADVGQGRPDSWLIAFDPAQDVAIACLVVDAGYGAHYAGPEVKAFLDRY